MKTTELIELLKARDVTKEQGYNLLVDDFVAETKFAAGSIADPMPQAVIRYFMYQIQEVLFPVIADLKLELNQVRRGGQVFKDALDAQDTPEHHDR